MVTVFWTGFGVGVGFFWTGVVAGVLLRHWLDLVEIPRMVER